MHAHSLQNNTFTCSLLKNIILNQTLKGSFSWWF